MITNLQITPNTDFEVVSLALAKQQLRIEEDFEQDDDLIQSIIDASVNASENYMGCKIVDSDAVLNLDALERVIGLPVPARSITSIKYFSASGDEITMPDADYKLLSFGKESSIRLVPESIPVTASRFDAVEITLKTGFEEENVPKAIVQAVLIQVSDMYDRREDRVETPLTASTKLLRPYKIF
jgi:uncharacterized phiE125 gp8 family phage protein